jgi:GNAT superfamily N-acetyltransferase
MLDRDLIFEEFIAAPGFKFSAWTERLNRPEIDDLISGTLDAEQPLEPTKLMVIPGGAPEHLAQLLRRDGRPYHEGPSPQKLYHRLKTMLRDADSPYSVKDLTETIPPELSADVAAVLVEFDAIPADSLELTIHNKSDPEGWVCGNYTDSCMSFGKPINDDYMTNPGAQYLTVKQRGRIVAQSVLLEAADPEGNKVIVVDNIEVANNYQHLSSEIATAYQKFWQSFEEDIYFGAGFTDVSLPGELMENRLTLRHPVMYADANRPVITKLTGEVTDNRMVVATVDIHDHDQMAEIDRLSYPERLTMGREGFASIYDGYMLAETPPAVQSLRVTVDGQLAGYLLTSAAAGGEIYVEDLVVHPDFRGQGVAKKLVTQLVESAAIQRTPIEMYLREGTSLEAFYTEPNAEWVQRVGYRVASFDQLDRREGGDLFKYIRLQPMEAMGEITAGREVAQVDFHELV